MLLEVGDAILVEEWTYPGAENTFMPYECVRVPIKMDGQGLLPEHLESVLGGWNESERGKKRPRVLYTIPTGQNPTGATMMAERKKAIYDVCQKYGMSSLRTLAFELIKFQMSSYVRMSLITAW